MTDEDCVAYSLQPRWICLSMVVICVDLQTSSGPQCFVSIRVVNDTLKNYRRFRYRYPEIFLSVILIPIHFLASIGIADTFNDTKKKIKFHYNLTAALDCNPCEVEQTAFEDRGTN